MYIRFNNNFLGLNYIFNFLKDLDYNIDYIFIKYSHTSMKY